MKVAAITLYTVGAGLELIGVWLLLSDYRDAGRRWRLNAEAADDEAQAWATQVRPHLHPFNKMTGGQPTLSEVQRTVVAVTEILGVNTTRQKLTLLSLVGGITIGLAGNIIGTV